MNEPEILFRTSVSDQWIDYNGHMTEYAYALVFGLATDALARQLSISSEYRERTGCTIYTLASQINFVQEVTQDTELEVDLLVLDATDSIIHVFQSMYDAQHRLKATYEGLIAHIDQRPLPKVAPFPAWVQAMVGDMQERHAANKKHARAGLPIAIRR